MLKLLPACQLNQQTKTKCGEIFCHSFTEFTIFCCFCQIKLFAFEDFLRHIQNEHVANNSLKSETLTQDCNVFIKTELDYESREEDICWKEDVTERLSPSRDYEDEHCYDNVVDDICKEEEVIRVISVTTKRRSNDIKSKTEHKKGAGENKFDGPNKISHIDETVEKKPAKEQNFPCPECSEHFLHKIHLDRHVFELHNGYKCSHCPKRFRLRHHLRSHMHTHNAERKFPCPMADCKRSFTDQKYLKHHLELHTMERTFVCDFENCGKAFQTQRRLMTHDYTHRKPKKLVCDICGYSCRALSTFDTHQRVHTGEKPFACEVCEKCFVSKTALNEHMITHASTRPHVCQICQATFANQRILQRHSFIHSDERTFKCKFCDKAFKQANGLDGHMRRLHREPNINTLNTDIERVFH